MKNLSLPVLLALSCLMLLCSQKAIAGVQIADLPEKYQVWLEEVAILITDEERETFLELEKDYQREAFIERFWKLRDPYPDTARNEFHERWEENLTYARQNFGALDDDRTRILLLNDAPQQIIPLHCFELRKTEIWYYQQTKFSREPHLLIFYQIARNAPYRLWQPLDGLTALLKFQVPGASVQGNGIMDQLLSGCRGDEGDTLIAALNFAHRGGPLGFASLLTKLTSPPEGPSKEWVLTFNAYSTEIPADSSIFDSQAVITYPGRHKSRTVVQTQITIPREEVELSDFGGHTSYTFLLNGEVLRDDRLFDNFRYRFNLPVEGDPTEPLVLIFDRYLRPGKYSLIVKIEDVISSRLSRARIEIEVPRVESSPPPSDPVTAGLLAEANAAISTGETTIKILPPRGDLQTGMLRAQTEITGTGIAEVVFSLDGKPLLKKKQPPFSVELDLGSLPRSRELQVTAFDDRGEELARDQISLNSGSHRFAIRLIEPRRGKTYTDSLRAVATLDVPEGGVVDRVEFYLNETQVATLYQPPYEQPILLPRSEQLAYVRAVGYQPDGNSTEEIVFVNAPDYLEELDVQFVELYVTVLDRENHPVTELTEGDFSIQEDGTSQNLVRFDRVTNLPIHAGILLDISASMEESLATAQSAALSFFQQAIQPRDRATLVTFNDNPFLAVKFTNDHTVLAGGLAGLKAERGTALYDAIVFSLHYFNGVKGQQALVILSDGKDEHSRFTYENALEYARRAGVAIYAIGLNIPRKQFDVRRKLTRFSGETGGRTFFIEDVGELDTIYRTIQEELRSRYYLAYQSSNTASDDLFRSIEVQLAPSGLEAKTLRGYYP